MSGDDRDERIGPQGRGTWEAKVRERERDYARGIDGFHFEFSAGFNGKKLCGTQSKQAK